MPHAEPALKLEPETTSEESSAFDGDLVPPRLPNVIAVSDRVNPPPRSFAPLTSRPVHAGFNFQPRSPVITGEATYRGYLPVDGIISGQLHASGASMTIKQRPRAGRNESEPELDGEICFKDMLRINGHVAGRVVSQKGTLIIDAAAQVDAFIDVGVAIISGTVNGEIVGRERVELGLGAVINGNISTPKLSIKPGATFQGDCRMLKDDQ